MQVADRLAERRSRSPELNPESPYRRRRLPPPRRGHLVIGVRGEITRVSGGGLSRLTFEFEGYRSRDFRSDEHRSEFDYGTYIIDHLEAYEKEIEPFFVRIAEAKASKKDSIPKPYKGKRSEGGPSIIFCLDEAPPRVWCAFLNRRI